MLMSSEITIFEDLRGWFEKFISFLADKRIKYICAFWHMSTTTTIPSGKRSRCYEFAPLPGARDRIKDSLVLDNTYATAIWAISLSKKPTNKDNAIRLLNHIVNAYNK